MGNQLVLDSFGADNSDFEEQKFEDSQIDNESEEDIQNIGDMSLSDLAISGTDWTVETIINQMSKGNIQLDPSFQRRNAWNNTVKSRFIESIFLGLPIPQIILAEQKNKKGKFIVIDGKQRLLSLKQFALPDNGENPLKLSGIEVIPKYNRMTYKDIENGVFCGDIDAFNNQTIRTVVIKNWKNVETLYLIFIRLNTGSVKLSPQELRQAIYPGKFIDYISNESCNNKELHRIFGAKGPDFRMRDVEILIRYYAFKFYAKEYKGSMQNFLDKTCNLLNKAFLEKKNDITDAMSLFNKTVDLVFKIFSDSAAFRKYKDGKYESRYNRAVIDIMLYYFSQLEYMELAIEHKAEICTKFQELCSTDNAFIAALESTTKSLDAVHTRFRKWGEALSEVMGITLYIPQGY